MNIQDTISNFIKDPKNREMLNHVGIGAGVGALGLGAAEMIGGDPDDNQKGSGRRKAMSVGKAMLLGGALGGGAGLGYNAMMVKPKASALTTPEGEPLVGKPGSASARYFAARAATNSSGGNATLLAGGKGLHSWLRHKETWGENGWLSKQPSAFKGADLAKALERPATYVKQPIPASWLINGGIGGPVAANAAWDAQEATNAAQFKGSVGINEAQAGIRAGMQGMGQGGLNSSKANELGRLMGVPKGGLDQPLLQQHLTPPTPFSWRAPWNVTQASRRGVSPLASSLFGGDANLAKRTMQGKTSLRGTKGGNVATIPLVGLAAGLGTKALDWVGNKKLDHYMLPKGSAPYVEP